MNRLTSIFISIVFFSYVIPVNGQPQSIIFDLTCNPIKEIEHSLRGEAVFSNDLITFRYGTDKNTFNIKLGENYVLHETSSISIIRGMLVPELIIRRGNTKIGQLHTFITERETMGIVYYSYQKITGMLTEMYINFEPNNQYSVGTEAIIVSQSICKQINA